MCVCETASNNCLCSLQDKSDTFQLTASATVSFDAPAENTIDRMIEPDQASVSISVWIWAHVCEYVPPPPLPLLIPSSHLPLFPPPPLSPIPSPHPSQAIITLSPLDATSDKEDSTLTIIVIVVVVVGSILLVGTVAVILYFVSSVEFFYIVFLYCVFG